MSRKRFFLLVLSFVALCLLFVGCSCLRTTIEVPVYVHDTTYVAKIQHDSTYIDRWHTVYQKGDTIFVTNEVTKIKIVTKTDTAYKYIEKPVVVSKMETVEVEKPLSWWRKTEIYGFWALLALFVLGILWKFRKVIFKI